MNFMIINQCAQKQWHIKESLNECSKESGLQITISKHKLTGEKYWQPVKSPESHLARSHIVQNLSYVARNTWSCCPKSKVMSPAILSSI